MTEKDFWRLIRRARRVERRHAMARDELRRRRRLTDSREILIQLGRLLEELPVSRIVGFHRRLAQVHRRACRRDLWAAAELALGSASRDDLDSLICWLILRGRRTFTRVVRGPDSLGQVSLWPDDVADAYGICFLAKEILAPAPTDDPRIRQAAEEALDEITAPDR
jgi:hypothetical protein